MTLSELMQACRNCTYNTTWALHNKKEELLCAGACNKTSPYLDREVIQFMVYTPTPDPEEAVIRVVIGD